VAGTDLAVPGSTELETTTGNSAALNADEVAQIVQWESEADTLTGEADGYRAQAAGLIVKLLDGGATQRQVAEAIGKSPAHIAHASKAWKMLQDDTTLPDFNTAYKRAKRPDPPAEVPESSQDGPAPRPDADETESDFPAWSKQMREATRLLAEMITQANYKQTGALDKLLVKMTRANLSKREDLEGSPGQT
jgi:hypothetical protein